MSMKKAIIVEAISYIFTLGCFVFVMYQACSCLHKYLAKPKSTDVTIDLASKHAYPAITFCLDDTSIFGEVLQTCNLTYDDYFKGNKWLGSCKDPAYLNEQVARELLSEMITSLVIESSNQSFSATDEHFDYKRKYDRNANAKVFNCFTYNTPLNIEIKTLTATFAQNISIFFGNQGDFYGPELHQDKFILSYLGQTIIIDVSHEAIEVLDFNGEACMDYGTTTRDECILETVHESSLRDIGCTSPFGTNKSMICIKNRDEANEAKLKFQNMTTGNQACPRSCKYLLTSFDTFTDYDTHIPIYSTLILKFPKFIKVSKSSWAYGMLELIAEVGGYVGLFLGVSVNQLTLLVKKIGKIYD